MMLHLYLDQQVVSWVIAQKQPAIAGKFQHNMILLKKAYEVLEYINKNKI